LFANIHAASFCNANIRDTECLTAVALRTDALCTTTNRLRAHPPAHNAVSYDMLVQGLREGAKHHDHATTVLDNRWNHLRQGAPLPPIPHSI